MLDIKFIRENPDIVKENIKKKFQDEKLVLVDEVLEFDQQYREAKTKADSLRGERNALSKQIEVLYCTRGKHLFHTPLLGAQLACACQEPLLQFGRQALDDFRAKTMSDAFTECVLDIIVSTGVVSNLVTHTEYYYNSSLAHCFYNASMVLPSAHAHLHGEVVSFGNLVLLAYDGQDELLERFLDFNTSIGLPVTLAQIGITTDEQLMKLVSAAEHIKEWSTGPEPAVREQFVAAIRKVDTLGAARLAAAA